MPPELRRRRSTVAFLLVSALVLTACQPGNTQPDRPAAKPDEQEHVAAGPLQGRTGAFLTVGDAASRVRVMVATLPGLLYRISTPPGSGLAPRVSSSNGRVRAALRPTGGDGPDEVRIVLNRAVRWDIRLPAGAGEQQLDLAAARLGRLDLGASGLVEINLPRPTGTVVVTLHGAVGTAAISAPGGVPVHLGLDTGAGAVTTSWTGTTTAVPSAVLRSPDWPRTSDRYAVRARSAVGNLTLRRR